MIDLHFLLHKKNALLIPHPLNICKCMHLHIFRDGFSRFNRENFHCFAINCIAMKSLVKIREPHPLNICHKAMNKISMNMNIW